MSDTQAHEAVTVGSDGVTVTKRYEADEFPVPAIAFNFTSRRMEPVTVRLSDDVPGNVAVEDLGFHPEYGSEYWTIEDDEITFEREVEPGAEYTTVYGIKGTGTDNVDQFLTEPRLDEVAPPLDEDEEALVGDGSDAVKDVISGDSDSVPGLEDDDVETLDLKDPNGEDSPEGSSSDEAPSDEDPSEESPGDVNSTKESSSEADPGAGDDDATDVAELSDESIVAAMANEIRNQNVTKEDVKLLRKAFDLATEDDGSVSARVRKLQQDVSDVIAYTDALEEFLDENGAGDELVDEFRSEVDEFRSEVEGFRDRIEEFDDELGDVRSTMSSNDEELDDIRSSVSSNDDEIASLSTDVDSVEGQVEDLESRLTELTDELASVREDVGDGDVEEQIQDIYDEIEELKGWREQLSSVIGGGE